MGNTCDCFERQQPAEDDDKKPTDEESTEPQQSQQVQQDGEGGDAGDGDKDWCYIKRTSIHWLIFVLMCTSGTVGLQFWQDFIIITHGVFYSDNIICFWKLQLEQVQYNVYGSDS